MKNITIAVLILLASLTSCVPKEEVVLRDIQNIEMITGENGEPLLKADAIFHNPNRIKMVLKEINMEVFLDGKSTAHSDQKMDAAIPAKDDFTIPLIVNLHLKEVNLLDTLFGFLSGKTHEVRYLGYIRVKVHGVMVKVPVDNKSEIKLKI